MRPADGTPDDRLDLERRLLEAAVSEHRRLVEAQYRTLVDLQDRTQQIIRLLIAVFAGSIALVTVILNARPRGVDFVFLSGLLIGWLCTLWALFVTLREYIHPERGIRLAAGPDPYALTASTFDDEMDLFTFHQMLLRTYPANFARNTQALGRVSATQWQALSWLMAALIAFGTIMVYLLWRSMLT